MATDKILVEFQLELDRLRKELDGVKGEFKKVDKAVSDTSKNANQNLGGITTSLKGIGQAAGIAFSIGAVISFGKSVIDATATAQRMASVLTNTLGSQSKAQQALSMITDFAAKTPFSIEQLTSSFVKLANQGFVPTEVQMRKLGDLASSTGKDFDMLAEAIIDAQTGEFERLKEFGIRAEKQGDKVKFTFKGVQTQVAFTGKAIQDYVVGLGDLQGVSGSMTAISATLGGKISNLGDSFNQLLVSIGESTFGEVVGTVISGFTSLLGVVTDLIKGTDGLGELTRPLISQQAAINTAVTAITSLNEKSGERAAMIKALNKDYPGFLGNLNAEKVTNEQLSARLKDVNNQYLTKIAIARFDENNLDTMNATTDAQIALTKATTDFNVSVFANVAKNSYALGQVAKAKGDINATFKAVFANPADYDASQRIKESYNAVAVAQREYNAAHEASKKIEEERTSFLRALKLSYGNLGEEIDNIAVAETKSSTTHKETTAELKAETDAQKDATKALAEKSNAIAEGMKAWQAYVEWKRGTQIKEAQDQQDANAEGMKAWQAYVEWQRSEQMKADQKEIDDAEEKKKKKLEIELSTIEIIGTAISAIGGIASDMYSQQSQDAQHSQDEQLKALEKRNSEGKLSDKAYQAEKTRIEAEGAKKAFELRLKQAKLDKALAIFNIGLKIAETIANYSSKVITLAALPFILAAEGIALAAAIAKPLPKYHTGKKADFSRTGEYDAKVLREEHIMSPEASRQFNPELLAMHKGRKDYEKLILENRIKPAIKRDREALLQSQSFAQNVANNLDTYELERAIRKNKTVKLDSATIYEIGKQFNQSKNVRNGS